MLEQVRRLAALRASTPFSITLFFCCRAGRRQIWIADCPCVVCSPFHGQNSFREALQTLVDHRKASRKERRRKCPRPRRPRGQTPRSSICGAFAKRKSESSSLAKRKYARTDWVNERVRNLNSAVRAVSFVCMCAHFCARRKLVAQHGPGRWTEKVGQCRTPPATTPTHPLLCTAAVQVAVLPHDASAR